MSSATPAFVDRAFFQSHPLVCARELIGMELVWNDCGGIIVETEAYGVLNDEACHTFTRPSARAFVARHLAGTAYVYLSYGVHWLLNVLVKGGPEEGIILIRALEPTRGIAQMEQRRGTDRRQALCSGPGKLAQAVGITSADHERDLCSGKRFGFCARSRPIELLTDMRIGISRDADLPWRFLERDSLYISVKPRARMAGPGASRKRAR